MIGADGIQDEEKEAPDWVAYYWRTLGREPRPLSTKGIGFMRSERVEPGQAVEVGFGDGTETLALLEAGWRVLAVDVTPQAEEVLLSRTPADRFDHLEIRIEPAHDAALPPVDLLYAGYALSFLAPDHFQRFWAKMRASLRPGGFVIVNMFGVHDTWAGDESMTFVDSDAVTRMLAGLDVLDLVEEEADGDSASGPKHWHVFDIVARQPFA